MNRRPPIKLEPLLAAISRGNLSDAESKQLEDLLATDEECRAYYIDYISMNALLEYSFGALSDAVTEEEQVHQTSLIEEFLEEEERAKVAEQKAKQIAEAQRIQPSGKPSKSLRRESQPSRLSDIIPTPVLYVGVAAAMLIAAMAYWPQQQSAQPAVVATLDSQTNASWSNVSFAAGDDLPSGEKITLERGIAAIEMGQGAIVKLQAPTTIELLGRNALHVHEGILLGVVEVEEAEGFMVRAPGMNVKDLGTKFGIYVDESGTTEVHVFEGKVEALANAAPVDSKPRLLTEGQAVRASVDSLTVTAIDTGEERFSVLLPKTTSPVEALPQKIKLPGTGEGIAHGQADPNWKLVAIDGQYLESPRPLKVGGGGRLTKIHPNDVSVSQWLAWIPPREETAAKECVYLLRASFDIPETIDAAGAQATLRYMADNELRAIHVNGNRVPLPKVDITDMFTRFHQAKVGKHWLPGKNVIEIELVNIRITGNTSGDAGFRLAWELEVPGDSASEEN